MSSKVWWILLGPLLFFTVHLGFSPELEQITGLPKTASARAAADTAAVTAWVACWWFTEAIPIPATSLLPVVLLPLLGILSPKEASRLYMDQLIFLFLGGFLIALAMERWGLHRRLALGVLSRMGGSRRRLILGFMGVTAFISMWISNTATMLMMVPVALAVVQQLAADRGGARLEVVDVDLGDEGGHKRVERVTGIDPELTAFAAALMLGVAYAANIGGLGTPVGTPPNLLFQQVYTRLSGQAVSFLEWMRFGVPVVVVFTPITWWLLVRLCRVREVETDGNAAPLIHDDLPAMSAAEKWVLGIFSVTALLWITRADVGDLKGWASRMGLGGQVEDSTVAIAAAVLLFLIPVKESGRYRPLLTWEETGRLPWGALLLLGAGFALSEAFQVSGLSHWLGASLEALKGLQGQAGAFALTLLVILCLITLLTEFASNTACAAILLPVLYTLGVQLGLPGAEVQVMMLAAAMGCSNGFMAPAGTAPNTIAYATGYVSIRTFVRVGLVIDAVGIAVITVVALLMR